MAHGGDEPAADLLRPVRLSGSSAGADHSANVLVARWSCSMASVIGRMRRLRLPDSPRGVAVTSVVIAVVAAVVRTVALGGLDRWVVAGDRYTDPASVTGGITVLAGNGYDGQFFYRLALRPWQLGVGPFDGIRLDTPFRSGRIAYPALAWVLSLGGRPVLVPLALVLVNIAAVDRKSTRLNSSH